MKGAFPCSAARRKPHRFRLRGNPLSPFIRACPDELDTHFDVTMPSTMCRPRRALRDGLSVERHMVVSEDSPRVSRWRQCRDVDQRRRVNVLQRPDAIGNVGNEVMLERPELAVPVTPAFLA